MSTLNKIQAQTTPQTSAKIPKAIVNEHGQLSGYIHSIETGAAVDGPGVRFVLFTSGCQLRCLYCHNPDTWKLHNGKLYTVENIVTEIGKYAKFLKFAGGLTISGGEPLLQAHYVGEIFYRVKKQYALHTALDTQGFLAAHLTNEWFDPIDLILLDIKHIDPHKHLALTGQPLQPTLDFAMRLIQMKKTLWVRYVLVPGWTDDQLDIENHANYVQKLAEISIKSTGINLIERVEILPFHKLGEHKWKELGIPYKLHTTLPPSNELLENVKQIYRNKGLECY